MRPRRFARGGRGARTFEAIAAALTFVGVALAGWLAPSAAHAVIYDVPILVESEDDLRDMLDDGDISSDQYETLFELIMRPLNPNRASRNDLFELPGMTYPLVEVVMKHREEGGRFNDVSDFQSLGVPKYVVDQLRPFVYIPLGLDEGGDGPPISKGVARMQFITSFEDNPATVIKARSTFVDLVEVGITGVLQDRFGPATAYQEGGLTWIDADAPSFTLEVPKFFARVEIDEWEIIAGTYGIGFAEKLVFSNTVRAQPNGITVDGAVTPRERYNAFAVRERLMGVAATLTDYRLGGEHRLSAAAWLSWWPYDVFQNYVDSFRRTQGLDDDNEPNPLYCEASSFETALACDDPDDGTGKHSAGRLRAAYTELIVGGRVAYQPMDALRVGVTSYVSMLDWQLTDDLVWARSGPYPNRNTMGAVGADILLRLGNLSLQAEFAHTLNGGNALVSRIDLGFQGVDVEVHTRWYDQDFDNPHAQGRAFADQYRGQRDRDEVGGGVRIDAYALSFMDVRLTTNLWYRETLDTLNLDADLRFDFAILPEFGVIAGLRLTDKDLSTGGRDQEWEDDELSGGDDLDKVDVEIVDPEDLDRLPDPTKDPGRGMAVRPYVRLKFEPNRAVYATLEYRGIFQDHLVGESNDDHSYYMNNFAQIHQVVARVRGRINDDLTLMGRLRWRDEFAAFADRGEALMDANVQVRWRIIRQLSVDVRYRFRGFIDEREGRARDMENLLSVTFIGRW